MRRFRGEAPFSTYGAARLLSFSSSRARTHSLLLLDNKRINVTLRSSLACAFRVADSALTANSRVKVHADVYAVQRAQRSDVEPRVASHDNIRPPRIL